MGVTIKKVSKTKAKATTVPKPTKVADEAQTEIEKLRAKVDKIFALNTQIEAAKEPAKEVAKLRKEILATVEDDYSPFEKIVVSGTEGRRVEYGPNAEKRTVTDIKKIHKMLGDEAFYAIASVSLTNIDKYLDAAQKAEVIETTKDGGRGFSLLPVVED